MCIPCFCNFLFSVLSSSDVLLSVLSSSAIILMAEDRAGCSTCIVFLMSCDFKGYVALPHGATGWCTVCDCVCESSSRCGRLASSV